VSLTDVAGRILVSVALGAAIGLERQWHHRLAGVRTNALVAIGASAFAALAGLMPAESSPTRVVAQVASGIGFLGAGVILREGFSVRGLNTAATLWCSAAVGSLAGSGFSWVAAVAAVVVIGANLCLRPLGRLLDRQGSDAELQIHYVVRLTCRASQEAHLRSLLFEATAGQPIVVRRLRSREVTGTDNVALETVLISEGRNDRLVEALIRRLRTDALITDSSWEATEESTDF